MSEIIANNIGFFAAHAAVFGFLFIFIFMTIESSFIPFPSEVIMIPAGFLAYRTELTYGIPWLDLILAIMIGLMGSMIGAYINYFLAIWLGRPFLIKYGKYFFLSEKTLNRADEIFLNYGEVATFVCRLLPGIRQLISFPAGLCQMNFKRFSIFTALGAGIWCIILALTGWYLGHLSQDLSYQELVKKGTQIIQDHYIWLILFLVVITGGYFTIHHLVMKSSLTKKDLAEN